MVRESLGVRARAWRLAWRTLPGVSLVSTMERAKRRKTNVVMSAG